MARGFDSKFVEAQQDDAQRVQQTRPALTPEQQRATSRREALSLARARALADLERATVPAHKAMLEQAIKALDEQMASLDG